MKKLIKIKKMTEPKKFLDIIIYLMENAPVPATAKKKCY